MSENERREEVPQVATRLEDLKWFDEVLTAARADLERTPEEYKPVWYRDAQGEKTTGSHV